MNARKNSSQGKLSAELELQVLKKAQDTIKFYATVFGVITIAPIFVLIAYSLNVVKDQIAIEYRSKYESLLEKSKNDIDLIMGNINKSADDVDRIKVEIKEIEKDIKKDATIVEKDINTFSRKIRRMKKVAESDDAIENVANLLSQNEEFSSKLINKIDGSETIKLVRNNEKKFVNVEKKLIAINQKLASVNIDASIKIKSCRVCFKQNKNNDQCLKTDKPNCSSWSDEKTRWTRPFFDDTDEDPDGCEYQWLVECR